MIQLRPLGIRCAFPFVALTALAFSLIPPRTGHAAPKTLNVEGVLQTTGLGPVADGVYDLYFAIYATKADKTPIWQEGPISVPLFGGRFSTTLGSKKALNPTLLANAAAPMLGVRVGKDPELPRRALHATAFALHAETAVLALKASDVACTGCVSVQEMKFDGDINLGGNSLKAANGTFKGNLVAGTVQASQFVGNGAKLTNLPIPKGTCGKGQVVRGIAADGTLLCSAALTGDSLPADGLASVSNGLLTNQFSETLKAGGLPKSIPDNTGSEAVASVVVPDLGIAQTLQVQVQVSNTDLSSLRLVVLPPNDKKVGVTLCDPCGAENSKQLNTSFPDKTKPKSGDLGAWVGKNPQGQWLLKALDSKFCIVQAPGNATLCSTTAKTDGNILKFDVAVKVLSKQKAGVTGLLQLALMSKPPVSCAASLRGSIFYDTTASGIRYCDGKDWRLLADTCGNGIVDLAEECDDGNSVGGDGCSATCVAGTGKSEKDPARSCLAIVTADKSAKTGTYWLDIDGAGAGKPTAYLCDMTKDGGGWTRVYAESPLTTSGWSNTKSVTAKVNGANAAMHGPFGAGVTLSKTVSINGLAHKAVRVGGRYFAIDSWDNERARVSLDGTLVFDRAKLYSQTGASGWTTVTFSPSPWTGTPVNGYWKLWDVASARNHTASKVTVSLASTIDQDISDESWLFDTLSVWVR